MSMSKLSAALCVVAVFVPGMAGAEALFLGPAEPGVVPDEPLPGFEGTEVLRYREVVPDLKVLDAAAQPAAPEPTIKLNLFDDAEYSVSFLAMEGYEQIDLIAWTGLIEGEMGTGTAVVVIEPATERLMGTFRADGDHYRMKFDEAMGRYVLAQFDPDVLPAGKTRCGGDPSEMITNPHMEFIDSTGSLDNTLPVSDEALDSAENAQTLDSTLVAPGLATMTQASSSPYNVVSLLVVLDADIAKSNGLLTVANGIAETNTIYAAQGNTLRLWDVRFVNSDHKGTGYLAKDLSWLDVSDYSNKERGTADLVTMIVQQGFDHCGLAWYGVSSYKFTSVVARDCMDFDLTFIHELGHNFGVYHDAYVSSCHGSACGYVLDWWQRSMDPPPKPCGMVPDSICRHRGVRDVMAYPDYCRANGFDCPTVPVLSDPELFWGTPTTMPPLPPPAKPVKSPFGDAVSNANRQVSVASGIVKNYR